MTPAPCRPPHKPMQRFWTARLNHCTVKNIMPTTKQQIRKAIAAKRLELTKEQIDSESRLIADNLLAMEAFRSAKMIALYKAIPGEVELEALFPACWSKGIQTCIPVYDAQAKIYSLGQITAETQFFTGKYEIPEPQITEPVSLVAVDLMVVPGVAFDRTGNRLGRGGGYYDRFLSGFQGMTAAVAFSFQLLDQIPIEKHDIPVDLVVTPQNILKVRNER